MRPTASATAATTVASVNNNTAASIAGAPTNTRWSDMLVLSEETRDLVNRTTEYAKRTIYYGWIPFILLLGFWRSEPRPSLFRMLNPLS